MMDNKPFYRRHIGLTDSDVAEMLDFINVRSLQDLSDKALPNSIKIDNDLNLPAPITEEEATYQVNEIINKNKLNKSFIGQGYHASITPNVIVRNLLENPAWYTAYTPYQAEISQGRLELLFHFQTLITELTGLDIANASLLDEGTSAAEACELAVRFFKGKRRKIAVAGLLHPQTLAVVNTRMHFRDYKTCTVDKDSPDLDEDTAALLVPLVDTYGAINDYNSAIKSAKENGSLVIFVADPLALTLLKSPGNAGADIVVGSMQRYGVAMGYGGPAAGFMAVKSKLIRFMPGRVVGTSTDSGGRLAYRLSLQTREQHIKRDKATSNICTSQVLLANIAAAYAIWHGRDGLQRIAQKVNGLACKFAVACLESKIDLISDKFFDCVTLNAKGKAREFIDKAYKLGILLRYIDEDHVSINFDETSSDADLLKLYEVFSLTPSDKTFVSLPDVMLRGNDFLIQPIFNSINSETEMMRFLRRLSDKDLALDRTMIPLGSCTMKMNAATELLPLSNSRWVNLHPFAPDSDVAGYKEIIDDLESMLCEITGFSKVSFQPNSGAQGEYAGLLAIKRYLDAKGESQRDICFIPQSSHGTNPASANMAGFEIVIIKCRDNGDIDKEDLKIKAEKYHDRLAAIMITYPSTYGLYDDGIVDICKIIHNNGGQVYFDGANLNALVGLSKFYDIGADVCHMNLHKTFAIPHGGGGPGCGPIGVAEHLAEFLPDLEAKETSFMVSSSPYGSASLLIISWLYIKMMGGEGLKIATQCAILNANYMAKKLEDGGYKILYRGKGGFVAHECIIDTRVLKSDKGVSVDDIGKRLIDYGFHAPTVSFPVIGTLMIEPTESEDKKELDRFCAALISIFQEAYSIGEKWATDDNPLINAPHTIFDAINDEWNHCYSRKVALYPYGADGDKYFSPVSRIDNVKGDKELICSCSPTSAYE